MTLVLLWFKNKQTNKNTKHKKRSSSYQIHWILDRVCLHMKACCPVVLVKLLSEFWIGCHTFSVNTIACTMYDSCPFLYPSWQIMMWLYIVPYLYIETKCLHSLPLPKSFTSTFLVWESELLYKNIMKDFRWVWFQIPSLYSYFMFVWKTSFEWSLYMRGEEERWFYYVPFFWRSWICHTSSFWCLTSSAPQQ